MSRIPPLPELFLERMQSQLGVEYGQFLEAMEGNPVISLRKNPRKPADIFPEANPVPWCETGLYLEERPKFVRDPLLHAGAYYVQEASSMLIGNLIPRDEGLRVLDLCAAPGGKSSLILSRLTESSVLVSNEIVSNRTKVLVENLSRWGYPNALVTHNRPSDFLHLPHFFDVVVVDAPCSGEGMFRKDPEVISHWSPANVSHCAVRQKEILNSALTCLKPGGLLIYSTCTYNTEENEAILDWIVGLSGDSFSIESLDFPEEWGLRPGIKTGFQPQVEQGRHAYLHKVKGEGFFLAAIRKNRNWQVEPTAPKTRKRPKKDFSRGKKGRDKFKNERFQKPEAALPAGVSKWQEEILRSYLHDPDQFELVPEKFRSEVEYLALKPEVASVFSAVKDKLEVWKAGITLGKFNKKAFIPDHDLAMSREVAAEIPRVELSYEEAIHFLKRESLSKSVPESSGWALVTWQNLELGWVKVLPNRLNNHLPRHWRIRADISEW